MRRLLALALPMGLLVLSCGQDGDNPTEPVTTPGSIEVHLAMSGEDPDSDGCLVSVDGGPARTLTAAAPLTLGSIPTGEHLVALTGVAANCTVQGSNPRTVQVSAGGTAQIIFQLVCSANTGDLRITIATTGESLDADGYTVHIDGTHERSVETSGQVTFAGLAVGAHELRLAGVAENCALTGDNPRTVDVAYEQTTEESLAVNCSLLPPSAPTGVAGSVEASSVVLTWTPGARATSQRVTVEDVDQAEAERQQLIADGTTAMARFDDLTAGKSYTAQVVAINDAGEAASDPVSFSTDDPTPGPLALYPLSGDARDSSGYDRHGTVVGAQPTPDRHGTESEALRFDGVDDYVYVPDDPWQDLEHFTLVAWVKTEVTTEEYIVARGRTLPYSLRTNGSRFEFRVGTPGGPSATATSTTAVDGRWHQVVGVYDGTTAAIYVDGAREGESPFAGPVADVTHDLEFGRREANARYFAGSLDDVAVYGQALSAAQISAVYDQPTAGDIRIQTSTEGHNLDSDGYTLRVEGDSVMRLPVNGVRTLSGWQPGTYVLQLEDVAPTCDPESPPTVQIQLNAGDLAEAEFVVSCRALEGRITFSHDTGVYTVNADGTDLQLITEGYDPSWSPDGSRIVFTRGDHVYIVDVASGVVEPLSEELGLFGAERPTWSPTGDRIAVFGEGEWWDVYLLPATGEGEAVPLEVSVGWSDSGLAWSPDGNMLAFTGADTHVWTVSVDDGSLTKLGSPRAPDGSMCIWSYQLDWSPDGELIAVYCFDPSDWEFIYVTRQDGSEAWITGDCQYIEQECWGPEEHYPTWSSDGSMMLFYQWGGEESGPRVQRPDGTGKTSITDLELPGIPVREYVDWIQ